MPSVNSANKSYELMATGENNGTWGIKTNSNLSIVDLNFGGRLDISVAGNSNVTISGSQAQNIYHSLTGVLTGSIAYIVPTTGSFYIIDNGTTGAFTVTVRMASGAGVVIPQGLSVAVFANPDVPEVVPFFTAPGYVIPISQGGTGQTTAGAAAVALRANSFIGGTSTGTANAQVVTVSSPSTFVRTAGFRLLWTPGFTNNGALTLNEDGSGAAAVQKITPAGLAALTGGEVILGTPTVTEWNGTNWVLLTNPTSWGGPFTNLASASTTDLGTIPSRNVTITGTTTITAFGSTASITYPVYNLVFSGALILTHNGTSLIIPGATNITTAAGDSATVQYLGSGNWRVTSYTKASGRAIIDPIPMIGLAPPIGLVITVTSNTQLSVTASQVTLTNGTYVLAASTVSLTIAITTSGVNGLDTGSEASSTWYYVYVIYNPTTSTVAGLLSASSTAPTLPSGYTYSRRVGAVRNNASSNLLSTKQVGATAAYMDAFPTLVSSATSSGSQSLASVVPATAIQASVQVTTPLNFGALAAVGPNASLSTMFQFQNNSSDASASAINNIVTFVLDALSCVFTASGSGTKTLSGAGWVDAI